MANEPDEEEIGTGEESDAELAVSNFLAKAIHLFLALVASLLIIAAFIATYDVVVREFPSLWSDPQNEYVVLLRLIEHLLLIAIAVEFALLLLFRRVSAVVEVVIFVLARKMVNPDNAAYELILCSAGIAGLIVLQYYYLPGRTK